MGCPQTPPLARKLRKLRSRYLHNRHEFSHLLTWTPLLKTVRALGETPHPRKCRPHQRPPTIPKEPAQTPSPSNPYQARRRCKTRQSTRRRSAPPSVHWTKKANFCFRRSNPTTRCRGRRWDDPEPAGKSAPTTLHDGVSPTSASAALRTLPTVRQLQVLGAPPGWQEEGVWSVARLRGAPVGQADVTRSSTGRRVRSRAASGR